MKYLLVIFLLIPFLFSDCAKKAPRGTDDFIITINYELGMHCTGFDFEYCCVLPPYNSIQAQVIKVGQGEETPVLLDAYDASDPTILVDQDTGKRYRLKYSLDDNTFSEGGKMKYWSANYDINHNGNFSEPGEVVANAYWTHLYIYQDLEGGNPDHTSDDHKKIYVGGPKLQVPRDAGPTGQKLSGYLRNSSEKGTVVFTKSPVLDNTPIVLTNPGIWEAVGLPLTPFLDSEMAGKDLKKVTEENIQPFQVARVTLVDAKTDQPVYDTHGKKVSFIGTDPIDVPNCSNCHANQNANGAYPDIWKRVKAEQDFWKSAGASDYYAEQKSASISMLSLHDKKHGTTFTAKYNTTASANRLGRGAVLCQKCHGDNVIGVLGGAKVVYRKDGSVVMEDMAHIDYGLPDDTPIEILDPGNPNLPANGTVVMPLTEAIHAAHQRMRPLPDAQARTGACQSCHPAHRQDRNMTGYPITPDGKNAFADGDNRDANGGCYVGRDVHSNPNKEKEGVGTPEHLNAIGQWLKQNVSRQDGKIKGLWCTNCHNQISRELYKKDRLTEGNAFTPGDDETLRDDSLPEIARALGITLNELTARLDPRVVLGPDGQDQGHILDAWKSAAEGRHTADIAVIATNGRTPIVHKDGDGDISVVILDPNPNHADQYRKEHGAAAPYEAATAGRDYWLSPGEPHCADCHEAPFVESQGGAAFPINQPGKYSLMRYSKGHSGLACQSCHESIHGLYPVSPKVDETSYRQAAMLNPDGSHGPLKCGACHAKVNKNGVPLIAADIEYKGRAIGEDYDLAVEYIHANGHDDGGAGGQAVLTAAQ